jgi:hypothetical protein
VRHFRSLTWWREVGGPAEQQADPVAALLALACGHAVYCRRDVARVMMALRVEFSGQDHPVGREIKRVSTTLVEHCARLIDPARRPGRWRWRSGERWRAP